MPHQPHKIQSEEQPPQPQSKKEAPQEATNRNLEMLSLIMRNSSVDNQQQISQKMSEEPILFPRTQSYGNLFTGIIPEEPRINALRQVHPQSYAIECLEYQKYLFDNRIKQIIKKMAIKAYNQMKNLEEHNFFTFPIQKLLVLISKKLLLNRFELLFLQYVFEETKWRYDIECIKKHSKNFNSFFLLSELEALNTQIRYMQIYILYSAYYSKKSLNELPPDNIFGEFFNEVSPSFKEDFLQWTQRSNMPSKINPKTLNTIFKKLTYQFDRDHQEVENYSLIVEQVLDISPAYNADKTNKEKKKTKKQKKKVEEVKPEYQLEHDHHQKFEDIIQQDSQILGEIPVFKNKKQSSFISNVDALEPRHYILRSASNQE